jgi:hypothetical protein
MANLVYRGPVCDQPMAVTGLVSGALLPSTFVTFDGTTFSQATVGEGNRLFMLNNLDFYTQTNLDAYVTGDTGVAYRLTPEQEYQSTMAAATYTNGQELTVNASGQLAAAATTNLVVAFFDQAGATLSAGDLADVVIANSYIKA